MGQNVRHNKLLGFFFVNLHGANLSAYLSPSFLILLLLLFNFYFIFPNPSLLPQHLPSPLLRMAGATPTPGHGQNSQRQPRPCPHLLGCATLVRNWGARSRLDGAGELAKAGRRCRTLHWPPKLGCARPYPCPPQ
jgi:hypothetical protein